MKQEEVLIPSGEVATYKIINHSGPGYNSLYSGWILEMFIETDKVGHIRASIQDDDNDDTEDEEINHNYYFYIHDLFVEPEFRMRGYANQLIQKIMSYNKHKKMVVNCNSISKSIFENNGFELKETIFILEK
jgi:GNAT superfamily N-acetyltransferase